jgi:hypothetical protein
MNLTDLSRDNIFLLPHNIYCCSVTDDRYKKAIKETFDSDGLYHSYNDQPAVTTPNL